MIVKVKPIPGGWQGATLTRPVQDQFYGERSGRLVDPFGHAWGIGTRIEEMSAEATKRRAKALYGGER